MYIVFHLGEDFLNVVWPLTIEFSGLFKEFCKNNDQLSDLICLFFEIISSWFSPQLFWKSLGFEDFHNFWEIIPEDRQEWINLVICHY